MPRNKGNPYASRCDGHHKKALLRKLAIMRLAGQNTEERRRLLGPTLPLFLVASPPGPCFYGLAGFCPF
jgi:hypothetical protein